MGGRGSGGQNKKSAEARQLEGNPGHRPIPEGSTIPQLPVIKPACPKTLDPIAKKIWRQTVREMASAGTIAVADRYLLAAYCSACSVYLRAQEVLDTEGFTQEARHGEAPRPEVKIAHEARQQIRALAAELGLTPKSRGAKPPAKSTKSRDALDEALGTGRLN